MRMIETSVRTMVVAAVVGMPASVWGAEGGDLPIREITLYRSGVGAFAREGTVSGDASVSLRFETEQINDILKSMIVLDLDGGRIGAVTYGSREPLARRLSSFGVDISQDPSIAGIFAQLRGSEVEVDLASGKVRGTILGVESRQSVVPAGDDAAVITEAYVSLVTGRGVRAIAVSRIGSFELTDPELAGELNKALAALAEHRADRMKTVDLSFNGKGERRAVVGYVHEMPVWKTSYRLVLPEEDGDALTVQGWAIVENTTDADWTDVRLSLASGRPVGFTMDLYDPIFAPRPNIPVPVAGGLKPRTYAGGKAGKAQLGDMPALEMAESRRAGRQDMAYTLLNQATGDAGGGGEGSIFGGGRIEMDAESLGAAQASGEEVGGQFMYTVDGAVTLGRQRSAMLPILTTAIEGRKVSIYNPGDGLKHPMRGVELTNGTGLHLMPGPVSVYDAETYAGDAQLPHTSRGQERLLAYALDIDVRAKNAVRHDSELMKIRIVDGLLEQRFIERSKREYAFNSFDSNGGRMVVVEHPRNPGWDLVTPEVASETLDGMYRFEVELEANGEEELEVVEEHVRLHRIAVTSYDMETVLRFAKDGKMSDAVLDAVRQAWMMQREMNRFERVIGELDREQQVINEDQNRIRNNMNRLDRNSELWKRYYNKLNDQETRLEAMVTEREDANSKMERTRRELTDYIGGLDVE